MDFLLERWALVLADFRREYHLDGAGVAELGAPEFWRLLRGLSYRARFSTEWRETPKHMHNPDDRAALIAAARR